MSHPDDLPTARCASCGRRYALTAGGVLRMHRLGRANETCPGSGVRPKGAVR